MSQHSRVKLRESTSAKISESIVKTDAPRYALRARNYLMEHRE
jgi:hypothetical protein